METANMVDFQVLFNIAMMVCGGLFGWLLNSIWSEIKSLQANERKTSEEIAAINVLVAGDYVKKSEFTRVMDKLFDKIDDIAKQINAKQDKA
jgi:hypothetical protein